jgi:hypothetical protein
MKYFQQIENERMVQIVAADSVDTCISYDSGYWYQILSSPFVGYIENDIYKVKDIVDSPECVLSRYDTLLDSWVIIK